MNTSEQPATCTYVRGDGITCPGQIDAEQSDLCFWHDRSASKEGDDIRRRLEEWAGSGESMEGFVLRYAHLEGVKLHSQEGLNLSRANLFRAHLQGASMFNIDLRGSELLKADFAGANLNEAKMQDADLLGAILDGTRLERVQWGEQAVQEKAARLASREGRRDDARARFEEAEEIYRKLRQAYDSMGRFVMAGGIFNRSMQHSPH